MALFTRKSQPVSQAVQQTPHKNYQPAPRGYVPLSSEQRTLSPIPPTMQTQLTPRRESRRGQDQLGGFPDVAQSPMVPPQLRNAVEQCPWCRQAYLLYVSDTVTKDGNPAVKYECPSCKHPVVFVPNRRDGSPFRIYPSLKK
ncbi:MAG: hypothetical protein LBT05_14460 [Planctomycetaceae bacterium]|jgi:hypothetical protein|nr:hypothetical protein [Planctomycetaceae bacterium]